MNISKKISGLLFLTLILQTGLAQNNQEGKTEESKWGIKFSGFLRFDVWHDTRMVNATREDLFLFYPKNERLNSEGIDLNHIDNTHASISASRLSSAITTPDVLNAKSSGVIEVDFYDANNAGLNVLRIRHAYFKFVWDKAEFIAGKTWHPLFVNEVYPDVVALNTGAPFQPFLRNPLILASYNILPSLKIIGAAITQRNKAKVSHDPSASAPFHYSKIPNLHAQLQYKNRSIVAGLAADFKRVRPSILTEDKTRFNDKYLNSTAYMAYFKYTIGDFVFRAKAIKGQNMSELAMLGGYAVESKDTITNVETYTPYNHLYFWINPVYGKKYCIGLFAGYALNLGTDKNTNGSAYYSQFPDMKDIEKMYRIAPSFSVTEGKFKACLEFDHTGVFFGTPDKDNRNLIKNSKLVYNNRVLLSLYYFFGA